MPLSKEEKIRLIEAYEPILYYHPDEKFVPVKPEAFMQASALWCTQPAGPDSRHKKENWNACKPHEEDDFPREPLIPKMGISVNPADDTEGTTDTDGDGVNEWYLGHQDPDGFLPYLVSNEERMLWLDMAAWQDSDDVTATSENKSCNVERAMTRWRDEAPLSSAVDWYYAEVQELDTLSDILSGLQEDGVNLGQIIRELFGDAWFIWYYFLHPIHQEDMRGCERILGVGDHGNYEGDWNAIGIIVRKPLTLPWEPGGDFPEPEWIGFGRRARGLVEDFVPFFRQQMDVRSWVGGEVRRVGTHPKVFVAKGSHNNYSIPGPHEPPAIGVSDAACGITEEIDEEIREKLDELEDTVDTVKDIVASVAKAAAGCGIGAIFGGAIGCGIGALVGAIAGGIEAVASGSDDESTSVDDAVTEEMERDHPPDEAAYGLVLAPSSLTSTLPDASDAAEVRPWAETPDRHLVDRELQIWWPGTPRDPGYAGRWGVMCQDDPYDRRSGINFPNFKRAFLLDLAIHLSK